MKYLSLLFLLLFTVPTYAGNLGFETEDSYLEWIPDCSKPYAPSFDVSDVDSYNCAVSEFNAYLLEVESYINCVKREANSDAQGLLKSVKKRAEEAIVEISSELNSVKSDLKMEKIFIE